MPHMYMPEINNAMERFMTLCDDRLHALYGETAPAFILERFNEEQEAIIFGGNKVAYLIAKHVADESQKMGFPSFARGAIGSSFSAFLLGITHINPLQAHYYCRKCKHVELMAEVADGYDLPDRTCPKCGAIMKGDGHDIPFEVLAGCAGDHVPDIALNVAPFVYLKSKEILQSLFPNDKVVRAGANGKGAIQCAHPSGYFIIPEKHAKEFSTIEVEEDGERIEVTDQAWHALSDILYKIDIYSHPVPYLLSVLSKKTGVSLGDISMNDAAVFERINEDDTDGIPEFANARFREIRQACPPRCFSELLKIDGLAHGTGVWEDNALTLLQDKKITFGDVLAFRDDVYHAMIRADVHPEAACLMMESVRKGRTARDIDAMDLAAYALPDWFYPCICKISYVFSKAHVVSYMQVNMQLAWFKKYHPALFEAVLSSCNNELGG